tara:strand:+ start:798 stop:1403 length:606 start_codon:yes stop_codon:yes gene_type:complete
MRRVFDFRGVKLEIVPEIYMPREDSFLFIDNLKYEMEGENVFTEIGVGSGIISLSIGNKKSSIIGVDINMIAALVSKKNAYRNNYDNYLGVCGDGIKSFRKKSLGEKLIFNPPYLPEDNEIDPYSPKHELQQLVGGIKGDEVINNIINSLDDSVNMVFTIISSLATNPIEFSKNKKKWDIRVVSSKNLGFETIWLLKLERI